jgi:uncharacterized membrane protein
MAQRTILTLAIPALVLGLVSCKPREAEPAPPAAAPKPAASVSDFGQHMTAHGTEPFWALTIDGARLVLSRPDQPDLVATAPGAAITPGRAIWVAHAADGEQLTVTLYMSDCSDGMSDLKYPMTAEVAVLNQTYNGCGSKTSQRPREGG